MQNAGRGFGAARRIVSREGRRVPAMNFVTDASTAEIPVLAFGGTVTVLGVARAFGRAGIPVLTYTEPGELVTRSRYYRPLSSSPIPDPKAPAAARLEAILRAIPMQRGVLVPCSDVWTEATVALPEDLKLRFPASVPSQETITTLVDKGRLAAVMAELGLPHPRSFAVDRREDFDAIDERVFESAFLKPKSSAKFLQAFGVKGWIVRSRAAAAEKLRAAQAAGCEMILQEYVPGPPTAHHFIDGFIDKAGVVRARFARQRIRMHPADFGNSTYMVSEPLDHVQPALDSLDRLLGVLRYRGIFSAEFKQDPRDGRFHLIEVNVRPWWYVGFAESCGVHVCALAYSDALGLPLPVLKPYPVGRTCAYPFVDLSGYRWHRSRGDSSYASLGTCVRQWLGSHQPIFAWDDPAPALSNFFALARTSLNKRLAPRPA